MCKISTIVVDVRDRKFVSNARIGENEFRIMISNLYLVEILHTTVEN
jgi:hypothetical protein